MTHGSQMDTRHTPTNELLALARVSRAPMVQSAVRAELAKRGVEAPVADTRHWSERLPAAVSQARADAIAHAQVWFPRYTQMAAEARERGHTFDAMRWEREAALLAPIAAQAAKGGSK